MEGCCAPRCYECAVSSRQEEIIVKGRFASNAKLYWQVKDYHGNCYTIPFTSDADGNGVLPTNALPEGFCNYASYGFSVEVSEDENGQLPLNIILSSAYRCIKVSIERGGEINEIGL